MVMQSPEESNNTPEINEIRLLPDEVVNQISAGEVIERPASVVRELVDNSIDAGATEVVIEVEEGGRRLVKVSDNGRGLKREDLVLAFQNHATSKLREAQDLSAISTFGFRGEALASIAAISRVEMRSRIRTAETGYSLKIEGGQIVSIDPVARGLGTEVISKSIFFNTPARRKFLKTGSTEEAKIKQWIVQTAIPNNQVSYKLFVDGKISLNIPASKNFIDRARDFLKGELSQVDYQAGTIRIEGLVGHPGSASSKAASLLILVNKRVIKDPQIAKGIREGFGNMLKGGEVPVGIISITLPPSMVDVNVHPQKSEVRFVNAGEIFIATRDGVSRAVNKISSPVFVTSGASSKVFEDTPKYRGSEFSWSEPTSKAYFGGVVQPRLEIQSPSAINYSQSKMFQPQEDAATVPNLAASEFRYSDLRYIGQLMKCYLLTEYQGQFVIVDMHAAHERVNYNLIKDSISKRLVTKQVLLLPEVVPLSPESKCSYKKWVGNLAELGFDTEPFGESDIIVRSVPSILRDVPAKNIVSELLADGEELFSGSAMGVVVDRVAARLACHGSIRSGKEMSASEAYALFVALDEAESAGACPHGRPVAARFRESDVERWFGRDR